MLEEDRAQPLAHAALPHHVRHLARHLVQPLAGEETPSTQPLAEISMDTPLNIAPPHGFQPMDEMALSEICEDGEPATQPVVSLLEPSTQPTAAATTQPSKSKFGMTGLTSSLNEMLKKPGDENASETTVTELPTEELPSGKSDD